MSPTTIPIVVVESHQHVLEHVHDVLRKKKIFEETWSMVHFDAHPDLACSKSAPAVAFFNPRHYCSDSNNNDENNKNGNDRGDLGFKESSTDLYELLDLTPSGIAEWILPLVLAAKLNKIEWVKPSFSSQISEGNYRFSVGVECHNQDDGNNGDSDDEITSYLDLPASAQVKVDFNHPYYLDDLSVVSSGELALKQNLELLVSELRSPPVGQPLPNKPSSGIDGGGKGNTNITKRNRNLWTLDICLDYFACHNPFISDLEKRNSFATRAFLNVMEASMFNLNSIVNVDNNQPITSLEYQSEIVHFYDVLKQLLVKNLHKRNTKRQLMHNDSSRTADGVMDFGEISKYFETTEQAEKLIRQLMIEINDDSDGSDQLTSMLIEAIPNWSMPHDTSSAGTDKINKSLRLVEAHIQQHVRDSDQPFMITIARSTSDGFCPPEMVEKLQSRVLDILHRQICGKNCKSCKTNNSPSHGNCCRLLLVRDYGEWEGSIITHNR